MDEPQVIKNLQEIRVRRWLIGHEVEQLAGGIVTLYEELQEIKAMLAQRDKGEGK